MQSIFRWVMENLDFPTCHRPYAKIDRMLKFNQSDSTIQYQVILKEQ